MFNIEISNLQTYKPLEKAIYHPSGELLHGEGEILTLLHTKVMKNCNINVVCMPASDEDLKLFLQTKNFQLAAIDDFRNDEELARAIYDDKGVLLLEAGIKVTKALKEKIHNRGIYTVYMRKTEDPLERISVRNYKERIKNVMEVEIDRPEISHAEISKENYSTSPRTDFTEDKLDKYIEKSANIVIPLQEPLFCKQHDYGMEESTDLKKIFSDTFYTLNSQLSQVLTSATQCKELDETILCNLSKQLLTYIIRNKDLYVSLMNLKDPYKKHIINHSIRCGLLSIAIASAMGYDVSTVIEIGYSGLMHDLGMLRVPSELVEKQEKLSPVEWLDIKRHPIHGINLLQGFERLPYTTAVVSYQNHERLNGKGYPKGRRSIFIHPFAKITQVADIYSALTSPRPYRKAYLPYYAMEEVILHASDGILDVNIVKVLLDLMSVFPVGSWVRLNNATIAKVIKANPHSYTKPVVKILYDINLKTLTPDIVNLLKQSALFIEKPVDPVVYNLVDPADTI